MKSNILFSLLVKISKMRFLITLCFIVYGSSVSIAQLAKIDPALIALSQSQQELDYIVLMEGNTDASPFTSGIQGKKNKGRWVYQYLKTTSDQSQAPLIAWLRQNKVNYFPFFVTNCIQVKSNFQILKTIAARSDVKKITLNFNIKIDRITSEPLISSREPEPEWGIKRIGADSVWRMGYDGKDIVVGGQDTGYDWVVSPLKRKYRGYVNDTLAQHDYNWHDAIHSKSPLAGDSLNPCGFNIVEPCDDNNHGTHTMGTMVGSDSSNLIGVAPGASWMACRNMERGNGQLSTYLECFEWFLAPTDLNGENANPDKAPHVINNSWYCSPEEGCNPGNWDALQIAVKNLKAAGVVVVVSAGNSGPGCETINAPPAHFEPSFSVGATMFNDTIANFSSRGPVSIDSSFRIKPDVSAPGRGVRSVIRGGTFASFNGTSMAGPHVAGLVALILSANPELEGEVTTIEEIIRQTADIKYSDQDCGGVSGQAHPNPIYGYGRINAIAAVEEAIRTQVGYGSDPSEGKEELIAYPNPAFDVIHVMAPTEPGGTYVLSVYNSFGVLVFTEKKGTPDFLLTVSGWAKGLYLAKMETVEKTFSATARFEVIH